MHFFSQCALQCRRMQYICTDNPQNFFTMPVKKTPGGYKWGQSGKVYPTKGQAERQGRAIYASGYKGNSAQGKKK